MNIKINEIIKIKNFNIKRISENGYIACTDDNIDDDLEIVDINEILCLIDSLK